ncbi:hypothetical protein N7492_008091 [Penicillium capsulatum]|uniref:Uncharacterized protein n=1 Tax=Penicillium capsulatum TaxID=69766 RepID=A0A9W9HP19_9EURO|nr:hypothetical protein N7492_008091 [Penicillium capsulatum]
MTSLPPGATIETIAVKRLAVTIPTSYIQTIHRFRTLVPQIDLVRMRAQSSPEEIAETVRSTGTSTDFVTFTEFDHGRWIRHFPPFSDTTQTSGENSSTSGRGIHRFIFGNPLFAIGLIRESREAALHVPLDCGFVEQEDGSTRMIILLPDGLVASHVAVSDNQALHAAALDLGGRSTD